MQLPSFGRGRSRHALLAAVVACLALPAGASADIAIKSFKSGPVPTYNHQSGLPLTPAPSFDANCAYGTFGAPINTSNPDTPLQLQTTAGVNSDFCVAFRLNQEDAAVGQDLNNTLVELPVGTYAEIDKAAKCTPEQFARESTGLSACPTNSQVGTALAQLQVATGAQSRVVQDSPGRIYALSTPGDKAALLGVALVGSQAPAPPAETKFLITVSQNGAPTVGLLNQTDTLSRVLQQSQNAPIAIWANALRFWGKAADHGHVNNTLTNPGTPAANFFRLGTTCSTPQTVKLTVAPYTGINPVINAPYTGTTNPTTATSPAYNLTNCENLPFAPTFSAALTGDTAPGAHPGLSVKITSPEGDEDLGGTRIALPLGVATDLTRIQNACPQATFEADQCGAGTVIGSVKATLSGIDDGVLSGDVQMVRVEGKTLPALGLDFNGRLPLRVLGVSDIDPTGRVVSTFSNLPSLAQRSLDIELVGGDRGILQIPSSAATKCQASEFTADLIGQNGKTKSFKIPKTCGAQFVASLKKADTRRPTLYLSGAGATGKKVSSIRFTLPSGVTINRNSIRSKSKIDKLADGVSGRTTRVRLDKKTARFSIPKPGSSGLRIMTRTGALGASKKFTERDTALTLDVRLVYTDGSKENVKVALPRKTAE